MVKESHPEEINKQPPPLDESWWQAVLAEEERYSDSDQELIPSDQERPTSAAADDNATGEHAIDWEVANKLYELDETIDLKVTGCNRGGLLVNGMDIHGFVPISHLLGIQECSNDPEAALKAYLDTSLRLKIIECDEARGRVVFSERAAQSEPGQRNLLLSRLKTGDCIIGRVTNITDFGIFVDLGGIEGLIHVSEISWGRVQHPADIVSIAQDIEVYVIEVDLARNRVALSLKRLQPNPWQTAVSRYEPGQVAEAIITSVVPFGAFARLEEGLDGLIHKSEMGYEEEINPAELLQEGQSVQVRVLHIDPERQRLGLSMNLGSSSADETLTERSVAEGSITK
jgi:small subunit ribosomal protein S1